MMAVLTSIKSSNAALQPSQMKKKVLIIEDDLWQADWQAQILIDAGYEVSLAHDGLEGIQAALSDIPDLAVLDLMMPKKHGYEVLERFCSEPSLRRLRILITSAKSFPSDRNVALELGADGYLAKPYRADVLIGKIWLLIGGIRWVPKRPLETTHVASTI